MDIKQQNRILYLRWLATELPEVYKKAVVPPVISHAKKIARKLNGLDTEVVAPWQTTGQNSVGDLFDDAFDTSSLNLSSSPVNADISSYGGGFDTSSLNLPSTSYQTPSLFDSYTSSPAAMPVADSSGGFWSSLASNAGSIFGSIAKAAPVLGQAYASTQGQLSLLQVNTQRAQQGLPPLTNLNGTLVTAAQLASPNAQTAAVERSITTGVNTPMLLLAGAGLLLVILLTSSKRAA